MFACFLLVLVWPGLLWSDLGTSGYCDRTVAVALSERRPVMADNAGFPDLPGHPEDKPESMDSPGKDLPENGSESPPSAEKTPVVKALPENQTAIHYVAFDSAYCSHNRSVVTVAGDPAAVVESAVRGAARQPS